MEKGRAVSAGSRGVRRSIHRWCLRLWLAVLLVHTTVEIAQTQRKERVRMLLRKFGGLGAAARDAELGRGGASRR